MDTLAYLGFIYDRKIASPQLIAKRSMRTGDGSFKINQKISKFQWNNQLNRLSEEEEIEAEKGMFEVYDK